MKHNYNLFASLCLIITTCIFLFSCIPSQPPQNTLSQSSPTSQPQTPSSQPQQISTDTKNQPAHQTNTQPQQPPNPPTHQPPQKSHHTLNLGSPAKGIPYNIQVASLPNDEGFSVQGSFGLSGTITRPEKDKDLWIFTGQFEFPSDKFKLGKIDYNVINAPLTYYTEKKSLPSDFPAQVFISIHITIPPDAKDEKGEFKTPFKIEMLLPKSSQFIVSMVSDT